MPKNASAIFIPTDNIFRRPIASSDHLLAASARIAIGDGDLRYFGL